MKQHKTILKWTGFLLAAAMTLPLAAPPVVLYAQEQELEIALAVNEDDSVYSTEAEALSEADAIVQPDGEEILSVVELPEADGPEESLSEEADVTASEEDVPEEPFSEDAEVTLAEDPAADSVVAVSSQEELVKALEETGTSGTPTVIQLQNDIAVSGVANKTNQLNVPKGAEVTITSKAGAQYSLIEQAEFAYDSSGAKHGLIVNNGTLTLRNITLDSNGKGRGVVVNNSATLTLADGAILKNGAENFNSGDGLGVYVVPATKKTKGGTFYMGEGAQIIDNTAEGNGGANGDSKGIGVYVGDYGTMIMTGGLISNNRCTGVGNSGVFASSYSQRGGGIAAKYATVVISGGEISNNATLSGGGGICIENAQVTLTGDARVINNRTCIPEMDAHSNSIGGGIYIYDGTLTIEENVEISGNVAESKTSSRFYGSGGGIFIINGNVNMNGGVIRDNIARFDGAQLKSEDELTQKEYDAFLEGCGGGVFIQGGTFTMADGLITGNRAESTREGSLAQGHGGGVYLGFTNGNGGTSNPENIGAFHFYGGTITENTVSGQGEDIYVADRISTVTSNIGQGSAATSVLGEVAETPEFLVSGRPAAGQIYLPQPSECTLGSTVTNGQARITLGGGLEEAARLVVCAESGEAGFVVAQPADGYIISNSDVTRFSYVTETLVCALNGEGQIALAKPQEVERVDLSKAEIQVAEAIYSTKELTPEVQVSLDGQKLQQGTDFVAAYLNNCNAGTALVTVTGIHAYTGTATAEFQIAPRNLNDDEIAVSLMPEGYFAGEPVELPVQLSFGGTDLKKGTDYSIQYEHNTGVGVAAAVLTGTGNYTGTKRIEFTISAADGFLKAATEEELAAQLAKAQGSADKPAAILLMKDIALTHPLQTAEETNAQIFGNGHTLSMETENFATEADPERAMLMVMGQSQIALQNLSMDGKQNARILYVDKNASLFADAFTDLKRGAAANAISKAYGGQLIYNAGSMLFDGSCGNTKNVNRGYGGIYNAGTLELGTNCRIYDILTCFGGALFNEEKAEVLMRGGLITDCSTNAKACYGTGVTNFGNFVMENGSISDHNGPGAAVYNKGSFVMKDGSISRNKNTLSSPGVGSRIHAVSGGGVFQVAGKFEMQGGEIADNTAVEGGGALIIGGTFELDGKDAKISGNHALDEITNGTNGFNFGNGGGVFINGGAFLMLNGQLTGNDAGYKSVEGKTKIYSGYGSAIFINGGKVSLGGGKIAGNSGVTAYESSNAIYFGNEKGIDRTEDDSSYPGEVAITESGSAAVLEIYGSPLIEDDIFVKQNNMITIPHAIGDITIPVTPKQINVGYALARYTNPADGEEDFLSAADGAKFQSSKYSFIVNSKKRTIVAGTDLSACDIQVSDMVYTGSSISPDVRITDRNGLAVTGFSKTVTSSDKINAGEKTVVIKGDGSSLTGQTEKTYRVLPRELTADMIRLSSSSFTRTGEPITPEVTVNITRNTKAEEKEYTVSYSDNVDVGTATVTVTAVADGNLSGSATKTFEIKAPAVVKEAQKITASKASFTVKADAKAFLLGAKTSGDGKLSYASSDESVAVVSETGEVTVKKPGEVSITIRAEETEQYKAATGTVKVVVTKADQTIKIKAASGSSLKKVYGSKAFALGASGNGKLSYQSSNKKVAAVSSAGKVTLKGSGVCVLTITAAGNDLYNKAEKKITLSVVPKTTAVKTAKNTAAKTLTVNWAKDTKTTGYQIRYSTKSNMKNAVTKTVTSNKKTSLKLTGLKKGKTYYIQIREYYMVDKKAKTVLYGSWSKNKKIKITK